MRLLIQPEAGISSLLEGINSAKESIELAIYRFDQGEIESALKAAIARGVFVHALIAYTNRGGEKILRKLEMRLLAAGVTVARTADDLSRYHYKFMIIDRRVLYLLGFNYTYLDINHSRSFGIVTQNPQFVQEAVKLFQADTLRQPYAPGLDTFIVSPINSRKQLSTFIEGAQKQLLIYDPKVSDAQLIHLLEQRAKTGVETKIIGRVGKRATANLSAQRLAGMRLHTRAIIRDRDQAFVGSQSLRTVELNSRREAGIIVSDPGVVIPLLTTFEADWASIEAAKDQAGTERQDAIPLDKAVKKVVKAITKDLPPLFPMVVKAVKEAVAENGDLALDAKETEKKVREAVREAVKDAVRQIVEEN